MDFIKTSSPRALSELTLQRNWIGIIWMSRSEDMIKIVKTVQTALSSICILGRAHRPIVERTYRDRPRTHPHPAKSTAELTSRPGNNIPRSSRSLARHHKPCTTAPREQKAKLRGRAARPMYRGRPIRANRKASSRDRPSFIGQNHPSVRPRRPNTKTIGLVPTVPMADYDPMTADRPDRPSERSDRPEARFEARFTRFHSPA
ncbi:unnamed protein product [Microthlaspi erraticum]|uniref:Uncharacterized protein n=1 Tax=Microthlaspi erraticum TaxID=1685480 RepID=A0A6D2HP96_9BRAS|nr:unnamed protein product [Microthlaspi erraticum]